MDLPPEQILKRVARLCNLVSKPELNGACVTIDSYDSTKDRFGVTTLKKPTEDNVSISILVKRSNLKITINPAEIRSPVQTGPLPPYLQAAGRYIGQLWLYYLQGLRLGYLGYSWLRLTDREHY